MITVLVAGLILISLTLVLTVPVALAVPGVWEGSQYSLNKLFQIWVSLVIVIAASDGIISLI